jgi:hypothetical protein
VTVARDGSTGAVPTGTVRLTDSAGNKVATGQLADGVATLSLPATLRVGTQTLTATYAGTDTLAASQTPVAIKIVKRTSTTKAKRPKTPVYKADFTIRVKVKAAGGPPARGKVKITYKGHVLGKGKLKKGRVTIKIKKDLKAGKQKLLVKYMGTSTTLPSKRNVKVAIVKAREST